MTISPFRMYSDIQFLLVGPIILGITLGSSNTAQQNLAILQSHPFQVLDVVVPLDKKVKSHRAMIVILSVIITGFLSAAYVLIQVSVR